MPLPPITILNLDTGLRYDFRKRYGHLPRAAQPELAANETYLDEDDPAALPDRTSDEWIAIAKRAGFIAREAALSSTTRRAYALNRIRFPRALELALASTGEGILTAARRAFFSH